MLWNLFGQLFGKIGLLLVYHLATTIPDLLNEPNRQNNYQLRFNSDLLAPCFLFGKVWGGGATPTPHYSSTRFAGGISSTSIKINLKVVNTTRVRHQFGAAIIQIGQVLGK